MGSENIIVDDAPVGATVEVKTNPDRYLFARWLRRAMKLNRMKIRELQEELGVEKGVLNNWLEDGVFSSGRPSYPNEQECHAIANLFGVAPDKVIEIVEDSVWADEHPIREFVYDDEQDSDNRGNIIGQ